MIGRDTLHQSGGHSYLETPSCPPPRSLEVFASFRTKGRGVRPYFPMHVAFTTLTVGFVIISMKGLSFLKRRKTGTCECLKLKPTPLQPPAKTTMWGVGWGKGEEKKERKSQEGRLPPLNWDPPESQNTRVFPTTKDASNPLPQRPPTPDSIQSRCSREGFCTRRDALLRSATARVG